MDEQERLIDAMRRNRAELWADYRVDVPTLGVGADRITELEDLLRYIVASEEGPCSLDHHGNCQHHLGGFRDGGCWTIAVRAALGEPTPPTEQQRAEAAYPDHHPITALANYRAGREVWDTNGDLR
jgi:hypothetical protein